MEELKSTIRNICILSVGICVLKYLISGTKLAKQMELIFRIVCVIVIAEPLLKHGLHIELPDFSEYLDRNYTITETEYNEELKKQSAENIEQVLEQQITASGVKCEEIDVNINIMSDNSILINKVTVRADDFARAEEIIKNSLGADTEVENGDYQ